MISEAMCCWLIVLGLALISFALAGATIDAMGWLWDRMESRAENR